MKDIYILVLVMLISWQLDNSIGDLRSFHLYALWSPDDDSDMIDRVVRLVFSFKAKSATFLPK